MEKQKIRIFNEATRSQAIKILQDMDLNYGPYLFLAGKERKKRSVNQSRWLRAWINIISSKTGMTHAEVHDDIIANCSEYIEQKTIKGNSVMVMRTSSQMDTIQFSEFMEKVHNYIIEAIELDLPFPKDKNFENFMLEHGEENLENLIE